MSQLARIHLLLGELDAAERHAHEAREIHESLGLMDAWKDYSTLSEIAQARGDTATAAEWVRNVMFTCTDANAAPAVAVACPPRC